MSLGASVTGLERLCDRMRGMPRPPRLREYLDDDLLPRRSSNGDVRNDNAQIQFRRLQTDILRYLEVQPSDTYVVIETIVRELGRRYPYEGLRRQTVVKAVNLLVDTGWLVLRDGLVQRNKVAAVRHRYLRRRRA